MIGMITHSVLLTVSYVYCSIGRSFNRFSELL